MGSLDLILLGVFGGVALVTAVIAFFCLRKAFRVANQKDGDLKMFLWTAMAMVCMIVAGMSTAYILIPILF
jgi:hypothetical protein